MYEEELTEEQKRLMAAARPPCSDDRCTDLLAHLKDREEKLAAVEEMMKALPPLEWEPYDSWGDYSAYPLPDGSTSGVDSSNSGDVHSHGLVVGEQGVRDALDRILHPKGE